MDSPAAQLIAALETIIACETESWSDAVAANAKAEEFERQADLKLEARSHEPVLIDPESIKRSMSDLQDHLERNEVIHDRSRKNQEAFWIALSSLMILSQDPARCHTANEILILLRRRALELHLTRLFSEPHFPAIETPSVDESPEESQSRRDAWSRTLFARMGTQRRIRHAAYKRLAEQEQELLAEALHLAKTL